MRIKRRTGGCKRDFSTSPERDGDLFKVYSCPEANRDQPMLTADSPQIRDLIDYLAQQEPHLS